MSSEQLNKFNLKCSKNLVLKLVYFVIQGTIEDAFVQASNVTPMIIKSQLPFDINSFDFKKYAEVYCPVSLYITTMGGITFIVMMLA